MKRLVIALLNVLFFPMLLLMRLVEEICGEGRWYRQQKERMENERPPLSDRDFLAWLNVAEADGLLWLTVRRAVAESCGIAHEALYPDDRLKDLWRMQWVGPDFMDILFRLERALDRKLSAEALCREYAVADVEDFGQFAAVIVAGLLPRHERLLLLKPDAPAKGRAFGFLRWRVRLQQ